MTGLVDFVIGVTLVEAIVLTIYHRRTGRGLPPRDFLAALGSGLALMIALRTSAGATAPTLLFALLLALAGTAHAVDLWRRWPG